MGTKVSTSRSGSACHTEHREGNLDAHPNINDASNGAFGVVDYDGSTTDDKNGAYLAAHPLQSNCISTPCRFVNSPGWESGSLKFDHLHTYRYYKSIRDHENVDQEHSDLFAKNALWAFISEIGAFEHDPCSQATFGACFDKLPRETWEEHLRQFSTQTHKAIELPQIFSLYGLKTASKEVKILKELDRFCIDRENFCKLGFKFFQLYSCDRSLANFSCAVLQSACFRNSCQRKLAEEVLKLYLIDQLKKLGYDFTKFINSFSLKDIVRKDEECKTFCLFDKCRFKKCPKKVIRKCLRKCGYRKKRTCLPCKSVCRPKRNHQSCQPKHSCDQDHSYPSTINCKSSHTKSHGSHQVCKVKPPHEEITPSLSNHDSDSDDELDPFLEFLLAILSAITLPKLPPCFEYKEDFALALTTKILANLSLTFLAGFHGLGHFNHLKHLSCCLTVDQISTILQSKNLLELALVKDDSECWALFRCDLCDALFSKSSFCFHNVELTELTDVNLVVFRKLKELERDKLFIAMARSHSDGDIDCSLLLKQICSILASDPKLHHKINLCTKRKIVLAHVAQETCKPKKPKPHGVVVKTYSHYDVGKSNGVHTPGTKRKYNEHIKRSKLSN